MGTIITSGVGSGLDVAGLVKKLVDAEGAPKSLQLDKEEAKVQSKLSALGTLRSALASFRDAVGVLKNATKFQGRQMSLSTPDFLSATASTTAVPGSYLVAVEQLASAHKVQSGDYLAPSTVVGTGTLHIEVGDQTFNVEIGVAGNTLAAVAAAINASPASEKVQATIVSGSGVARLTLTARNSGLANELTITQSGGDAGLAAFVAGLDELKPAADARVLIDGVLATSATNTITGPITGVDLTVKAVTGDDDEATEVTVGYDRAAARKSLDEFVKSYNALVDAMKSVTGFNVETRQAGPLFGDGGVRNIVEQLRRELSSSTTGVAASFDTLAEIGITAQLNGKLAVDAEDLDAAFNSDFDAIGKLFANEKTGVAVKLDALLEPYLGANGVFDSRTEGLKSSIETINERRERLNQRLVALHTRYTNQFNALDGLLAQLQGTGNFLNQQLGNLPGSAPLTRDR
jgi:flagellar hook-associated protein 2